MGETREMTLEEWMGGLPTNHTANREYEALRTEIARLKAEVGRVHQMRRRREEVVADLRKELERLRKVNDEYAETAEEKYDLRTRLEKAEAGMHDKCSCVGCSLQYTAECVPYSKLIAAEEKVKELTEGLSAPVPHNDNAR